MTPKQIINQIAQTEDTELEYKSAKGGLHKKLFMFWATERMLKAARTSSRKAGTTTNGRNLYCRKGCSLTSQY